MVWHKKLIKLVESAESIELRVYRSKVRDELLKKLNKKREEMRAQGRYPYRGEWLSLEDISIARENERKENFSKLVLVILLYILLFLVTFIIGFLVWRSAS